MSDKSEGNVTRALATLVSAALVLGLSAGAFATVHRVPNNYPTIQAGVDAAGEGDTVLVADGTYTGDGNRDVDFGGKAIALFSEHGPRRTIIDCEGTEQHPHCGFYFHSNEGSASVVRGFTITNGRRLSGGAILCVGSSPTILYNIMTGNTAEGGGAILCRTNSHAIIIGNMITGNTASLCGGGIYCHSGCPASIENNLITANTAVYCGGGIRCDESSPAIVGNTLVGNTASYGGGICDLESSFPTVLNSILWGNGASIGDEVFDDPSSSIVVTYCNVEGGWEGEGNIDADPLFVSGPLGGYYLSQIAAGQAEQSPCVDAGGPGAPVPWGTTRTDEVCDTWPIDMGYHYRATRGARWYVAPTFYTVALWAGTTLDTTMTVANFADSLLGYEVRPGTDWVTVDPAWGGLAPGEIDTLSVTFSACCLAPGGHPTSISVVFHPWSDTVTVPCDVTADSSLITTLTLHETAVHRGDTLGYTARVENPTDSPISFDAWIDAYQCDGSYYQQNPVAGPVTATIDPGGDLEGNYRLHVPQVAPIAEDYRLCFRVGCHSENEREQVLFDEDCHCFDIIP